MFGAIGPAFRAPVFMLADSTNSRATADFVAEMMRSVRDPYSRSTIHVVLDNHPAHHSVRRQLAANHRIKLVFQPAYSPEFNCQEVVWRAVKVAYRKRLLRRDEDIRDYAHHKELVREVLREVGASLQVARLMRANNAHIDGLLS